MHLVSDKFAIFATDLRPNKPLFHIYLLNHSAELLPQKSLNEQNQIHIGAAPLSAGFSIVYLRL